MKDLTLSAAAVILIAVVLGLLFHAVYPRVEPSAELAGLFVFLAAVVRLLLGKAWAAWRSRRAGTTPAKTP